MTELDAMQRSFHRPHMWNSRNAFSIRHEWLISTLRSLISLFSRIPHNGLSILVGGFNPSEKYFRQLGWWHSQFKWENKSCSSHHQPVIHYNPIRSHKKSYEIIIFRWLFLWVPVTQGRWGHVARFSEDRLRRGYVKTPGESRPMARTGKIMV